MLVNDEAAKARLNSPLNLINKMKNTSSRDGAMGLFGINRKDNPLDSHPETKILEAEKPNEVKFFNPFEKKEQALTLVVKEHKTENQEPRIDDLIDNHDTQIKLATAHDKALDVLTNSINMLKDKLDDIRPDKLPAVITATSKVVEGIRKERNEAARNGKDKEVHYHFYTPIQKRIESYDTIEVS
jgi:hypothetical protein